MKIITILFSLPSKSNYLKSVGLFLSNPRNNCNGSHKKKLLTSCKHTMPKAYIYVLGRRKLEILKVSELSKPICISDILINVQWDSLQYLMGIGLG